MTNDSTPCGQECEPGCATTCPMHNGVALEPIHLDEARERFTREARQGTCDTGRYRMRYYVWGEGPPLVFIHGVSDRCDGFVMPISRLSRQFRCIAYDLPQANGDGARLWRYNHDDLVTDLFCLLDQVQAKQVYLLGSSFGSTIALKALRREPERLPCAILQGGFARRRLRPIERALASFARILPGTTNGLPYREKISEQVHGKSFIGQPERWRYFMNTTGTTRTATFAHQVLMLGQLDLRPILADIRQPVLLMGGELDKVIPRPLEEVVLAGLPNARRIELEGVGHLPSYSHPELMVEVIQRFLLPRAP